MPEEKPFVERLELSGYKSIRQAAIDFTRLNVLIGANGSGKSNLVSFFSYLRVALDGRLDGYVGRHGGPNSLLYLGAKRTSEIAAALTVRTAAGTGTLYQRAGFRAPDSLFYSSDHAGRPQGADRSDELVIDGLCSVVKHSGQGHPGQPIYFSLKDRLATYHLDDTSLTSPIRTEVYIQDNGRLRSDAGNLAAVLNLYKTKKPHAYQRIRSTVRKVAPAFDDFVLEPQRLNPNNILLNWKQRGSDYLLGPHQLSDGSLRAMALTTLFLQPAEDLPDLLIVDEPELGLHPHALTLMAGLIRAASVKTQVLVTTQSPTFLDQFAPDEVIVAEAPQGATAFRRLDPEQLKDWLEDYSVGELWQKNVIGGGPLS
jgi:predicted ATPase